MAASKQKIHGIIHEASAACAGIGGGLAQYPSATAAIQTAMIKAIAAEHGIKISEAAAAGLLLTLAATARSRLVPVGRQAMAGWLPGIDNDTHDSTTKALTEAIGWAAYSHFDQTESKT